MKIVSLILYMCSTISNNCPSSTVAGYQFNNHYDCVASGYRIAHNTFLNLEKTEEFEREKIEREKLVIKFECKELGEKT